MFKDRPEVRAVMEFFTTGESLKGGLPPVVRCPRTTTRRSSGTATRSSARLPEIAREADTLRFDASDLMPGEVGTGSFWKAMTSYISGTTDLDTALKEIDASWPQ